MLDLHFKDTAWGIGALPFLCPVHFFLQQNACFYQTCLPPPPPPNPLETHAQEEYIAS